MELSLVLTGEPESEGSPISRQLWDDALELAFLSLHNPFVRHLADGTLPRESFVAYLTQDLHYLTAFAESYSAGISKAAQVDPEAVQVLEELLQGVRDEISDVHNSYVKDWGITAAELKGSPSATTTAYTDFLLNIARGPQSLAHLLAAMVPCSRLYGYLGCQMVLARPNASHQYSRWARSYSSAGYLGMVQVKETLLNRIGRQAPYGELRNLYRAGMRMEAAFFSDQPLVPALPPVGLLAVDFDDTCTAGDTISLIINAAISAAEQQAGGGEGGAEVRKELEAKRDVLVTNYITKLTELLAELLPKGTPLATSLDELALARLVDQLSEFDRKMNGVVVDSGILTGIPDGAISRVGRQVKLQQGSLALLQRAQAAGVPTHIISVNWSSELVRAALQQAPLCGDAGISGKAAASLASQGATSSASAATSKVAEGDIIVVNANELEYSRAGLSTGNILRKIECGADKGVVFDTLLLDCAAENGGLGGMSVYIGDSASDLPPLMAADLGIIIGSSSTLRRVCAATGVQLKSLAAAPADSSNTNGILYEATSWAEVDAFLFGPRERGTATARPNSSHIPRVLTVAGSDSGGGAGIQADLKTFMARGVFGTSAITALTAQNTHGVMGVHVVPTDSLRQQMDAVLCDIGADVVKTGMLPNAAAVVAVADCIVSYGIRGLVVDPVLVATSGDTLAGSEVMEAIKGRLFPLATVITPNVPEASAMLGGRAITDLQGMKDAAIALHALGPAVVLVKGGHLVGSPGSGHYAVDVAYDGHHTHEFSSEVISTGNTHGTGCTLAAAIAAELAKGAAPLEAVRAAKGYLTELLRSSAGLQIGTGVQRPMNHGFEHSSLSDEGLATSGRSTAALDIRAYVVTDPDCNAMWGRSNADAVKAAVAGGATIVQIREKDANGGAMLRQVDAVLAVCRPAGIPVIVNDRVDVAIAAGADGVHVGQDDLPVAAARKLLGPDKILGVSVRTVEEALAAEARGADYLGSGAMFPTSTKDCTVISLATLSAICSAVRIPVVAIGGINADNAASTVTSGAAGVAVVSAVFGVKDPASATQRILEVVNTALDARK